MLALPGGARGELAGDVATLLEQLPAWRVIAGISDGLLTEITEKTSTTPSLDDVLLGSWTRPFGWMLIGEPIGSAALRALASEVAARQHLAEGTADRFPGREVDARQLKERHAEMRRGLSTGMWRTYLIAGGADAQAAARVAGLFCASADLRGLPYAVMPAPRRAAKASELLDQPEPLNASTEFLAAIARPPSAEVPGLRLGLRPDFDITPETRGDVFLGEIKDRNLMPAGPLTITTESLNRHVFVTGATGAGKSQTIRGLLENVTVPWLVIEPAKAEYRLMSNRVTGGVVRIRPGEADAIPAGINPLEPAEGFHLQTHADLVKALFIASFRSEEPFPQVLSAALTRAYSDTGWDLAIGETEHEPRYPSLSDLQRAAERVVAEIGYSQRITDDVLGFMRVRLASLRHGTSGRFLAGGHPIDFSKLMTRNVVLEIEDVGDDRDKAFLMGTVLIRLAEYLRVQGERHELTHLTVVEEAHRLLRRQRDETGAAAHAVEMFAGLLSELRAYGEGLIIADQIPARLIPDVIKNTAVKIAHRLPAADDREVVGATMNLSPAQSRYLVTLAPGEAAVSADGMDRPILVKVRDGTERERALPARTGDCTDVIGRRGVNCGAECVARPCTLREMRLAQRELDGRPVLRLWTELTVLAHLTGWPMPVPRAAVLEPVRGLPARTRQCAIGHAVDEAIAGRAPALASRLNLAALARHVWTALDARIGRDMWLCQPREPGWQVPVAAEDPVLFGVTSRPPSAEPSSAEPSAMEKAVGARRGDDDFAARLAAALEDFTDCRWPVNYLAPGRVTSPGE
jgi:uncharacterized protein